MNITRLIFAETGTYNDMVLRPYEANLAVDTLHQLQEVTRGGENIETAALAGVAGAVIRPTAQAAGMITIPNSWDTRRLRFMMEVVHDTFAGTQLVQYLTGYTDHLGVSALTGTVHLDPNMRLYINNSVMTRVSTILTPLGRQQQQTISDASHILSGSYAPDIRNPQEGTHSMRPEDVFKRMQVSMLQGDYIFDARTAFSDGIKKSRRSNNAAPSFLNRVLQAHHYATTQSDTETDFGQLMHKASAAVKESAVSQDPFLAPLLRNTSLSEGNWITYRELCMLSPGLDNRAKVIMRGGLHQQEHFGQLHERGSSEYWQSTTMETVFATILCHSVPAVMMDLMLTKVAFQATNQTLNGMFDVTILQALSFAENIDLTPYMNAFVQRLSTEILRDLTQNNLIDIQLTAMVDILGETSITISVAGAPPIHYVMPSFCDALMAPVMANSTTLLDRMAHDVSSLVDNLATEHLAPANTAYPSPNSAQEFNHGSSKYLV